MEVSLQWQLGAGDGFWQGYGHPGVPIRRIPDYVPDTAFDTEYVDGFIVGFMRGQATYARKARRGLFDALLDAWGITWLADRLRRLLLRLGKTA